MRLRILVCVLACLALPSAARAATVTGGVEERGSGADRTRQPLVRVDARAGDADDLTLTRAADGVTVRSAAGPLTAAGTCRAAAADVVVCPVEAGVVSSTHVRLGDGDDRLAADGLGGVRVDGGPGADRLDASGAQAGTTLIGGSGDDVLVGSPGADRLDPGPGADVADGGAGDDVVAGDTAPGDDRLDGGPGRDRLEYGGVEPVRVDLAAGRTVRAGAIDAVAGFESAGIVRGTLSGSDAAERLDASQGTVRGGGGDDDLEGTGRVDGGAGDDRVVGDGRLTGGPGADRLTLYGAGDVDGRPGEDRLTLYGAGDVDGGLGDDVVEIDRRRLAGARVRCGAGDDRVTVTVPRLAVPAGCEAVQVRDLLVEAWRVPRAALTVRLGVRGDGAGATCPVRLRVGATAVGPVRLQRRTRRFRLLRRGAPPRLAVEPRRGCPDAGVLRLRFPD